MDLFTLAGKIAIDCTEAETKIDNLLTKVGNLNTALNSTGGSSGGSTGGSTDTTSATPGMTASGGGSTTAGSVATGTFFGNLLTKAVNLMGGWVVDLGKEGYNYELNKETYIAELKTMMGSTWEEAEAFFNELNTLAISSPLNMSSLGTGASRFLSLGFEPDKIMEMMTVLGDIAKGDNSTFVRILKAVSDVYGKGGLKAQEKNQFAEAGVPIFALLADYEGAPYNTPEERDAYNEYLITKMERGGTVSADDVWGALLKSTQEGGRFHNAMEIAMGTGRGQAEKLDELKQKASGTVLSQLGVTDAIEGITRFINNVLESDLERVEKEGLFGLGRYKDVESVSDFLRVFLSNTFPSFIAGEKESFTQEEYDAELLERYLDSGRIPEGWVPSDLSGEGADGLTSSISQAVTSAINTSLPGAVESGMGKVTISAGNVTLNDGTLVGRFLPLINIGLGRAGTSAERGNA